MLKKSQSLVSVSNKNASSMSHSLSQLLRLLKLVSRIKSDTKSWTIHLVRVCCQCYYMFIMRKLHWIKYFTFVMYANLVKIMLYLLYPVSKMLISWINTLWYLGTSINALHKMVFVITLILKMIFLCKTLLKIDLIKELKLFKVHDRGV